VTENHKDVSILIVEDDDIDAMAIQRSFKKLRLLNPLIRAKDGLEALEYLRGTNGKPLLSRPNIILLDINMPRMSGIELLEEIRKDADLHDTVVFVLTTSKAEEDIIAAHKYNVAGYIIKEDMVEGFTRVIELLSSYWKVVVLPE
jgi:CheY-like chemotaxis protein